MEVGGLVIVKIRDRDDLVNDKLRAMVGA